MSEKTCQRCGERPAGFEGPIPFREPFREEVREKVCGECWQEWLQTQIKLINELALNLGDSRSHDIIEAHAKDFLGFTEGETGTDFDELGEEPPSESRPH